MGRRTAKPLTVVAVTRRGPGLHSDGHVAGLYLAVGATGSRSWIFRYSIGGKRRDMGLGSAGLITLAKARELAADARKSVYTNKIDPLGSRRAGGNTFAEIAERYITDNRAGWRNAKHADQWSATLEKYAYPVIGNMAVDKITTADVKKVLDPIWSTRTETATRVRQRIENVLDAAKALELREGDNPAAWAGNLKTMLPKPSKVATVKSHAAMPYAEVPAFMVRLRAAEGTAARMLELAILCASRSNEVRGAVWSEIDLDAGLWVIPAGRMKASPNGHRVPLSEPAIALLKAIKRDPEQPLVFPSATGRPFSDAAMAAVLKRLKVDVTQHGFRSSFRDWTTEKSGFPSDAAEHALAHQVGSKTERAYARSDMLEIRRELMAAWSRFLSAKRSDAA
jgi:integrase